MKKYILSIMVVAASMVTFSAMAKETKGESTQCKKESCDKKCSRQGMKKDCPNPFEGMNLTQEQKDKLKALAPCQSGRVDKQKMRQQRDSIAKAARVKHLADIKAILTPEQYVQYLENLVLQAPNKDMKNGRGHRHERKGGMKPGDCGRGDKCQKSNETKK